MERSPIKRQIIAMGGGGFSMEPENLALDRYILAQALVSHPKVCFVPTASGDAEGYIQRFYAAFETLPWLAVTAPFIVAVK